jgi:hypothetical protein
MFGIIAPIFGLSKAHSTELAKEKTGVPESASSSNPEQSSKLGYQPRGTASQFDDTTYNINSYQYPDDLLSDRKDYGNNYVIFYINVSGDSKLLKGPTALETVEDVPPRDNSELAGLSTGISANNQNVLTGTGGAVGAATILGALRGGPGNTAKSKAAFKANLASKVVGVGSVLAGSELLLKDQGATFTNATKRLKTAIALHMPNQMNTKYSINYEEDTLPTFAAGMALDSLGSSKGFGAVGGDVGAASLATLMTNADALGITSTSGIQRLSRLAPNPRKEQIFKNVDFRTFQFTYEFYPRNEREATYVENIIEQFKFHMHPEYKDSAGFLYVYPSEFDIFYYHGSEENLHVNRHTSCVLTELDINYAPQSQFTSFDNGMPTQINITMTFKELATLTKEKIRDKL